MYPLSPEPAPEVSLAAAFRAALHPPPRGLLCMLALLKSRDLEGEEDAWRRAMRLGTSLPLQSEVPFESGAHRSPRPACRPPSTGHRARRVESPLREGPGAARPGRPGRRLQRDAGRGLRAPGGPRRGAGRALGLEPGVGAQGAAAGAGQGARPSASERPLQELGAGPRRSRRRTATPAPSGGGARSRAPRPSPARSGRGHLLRSLRAHVT